MCLVYSGFMGFGSLLKDALCSPMPSRGGWGRCKVLLLHGTVFFSLFFSYGFTVSRAELVGLFCLFVTLSYNSWLNFDVLLVVWGGVGAGQGPVSGSRKLGKVGGVPPPAFGLIFRGRKQVRALFCRTTLRREGRVGAELLLSGCDNGLRRGLESTCYVSCVGWC